MLTLDWEHGSSVRDEQEEALSPGEGMTNQGIGMGNSEPESPIKTNDHQLITRLEEHWKAESERWKMEDARRITGIIFKIGGLFFIVGLVTVIGWLITYYNWDVARWVSDWYWSMTYPLFIIGALFWVGAIVYAYSWKYWEKAIERS